MCQLLGMNCNQKTDYSFSFSGFRLRGGQTDKHAHGFGISFYEGRGVRTFVDTAPAATSPVAEMISNYPIKTLNMISHIRFATQGRPCLANVHPFQRELWGCYITFCHNGDIPKFSSSKRSCSRSDQDGQDCYGMDKSYSNGRQSFPLLGKTKPSDVFYTPVGDTDSEAAFCAILNALKAEFDSPPPLATLYRKVKEICYEIVSGEEESSIFNMLLACGQNTQFSFSWPGARPGSKVWNGLFYTVRQPPFTTAELVDMDYKIDFSKYATAEDRVAVITTKPLTKDETWIEMKKGELLMFNRGLPYAEECECETLEKQGRGLSRMPSMDSVMDSVLIPDDLMSLEKASVCPNQHDVY